MELKKGGYYITRDGGVRGPIRSVECKYYPYTDGTKTWTIKGEHLRGIKSQHDLVEEMETVSPLITKTMVVSYVTVDGRSFRSMREAAQDLIAWRRLGQDKPPMAEWIIDNREWLSVLFKEVDNDTA